jgi:hypothetical protein
MKHKKGLLKSLRSANDGHTSTHFLLPDTSVPMETNTATMQKEATYTPETSELTYIKQTSNCEVSFSARHVQ